MEEDLYLFGIKIKDGLIGKKFSIPYISPHFNGHSECAPRGMIDQTYSQVYKRVYEKTDDGVEVSVDPIDITIEKAELNNHHDQHISFLINDKYVINLPMIGNLLQDIAQLR